MGDTQIICRGGYAFYKSEPQSIADRPPRNKISPHTSLVGNQPCLWSGKETGKESEHGLGDGWACGLLHPCAWYRLRYTAKFSTSRSTSRYLVRMLNMCYVWGNSSEQESSQTSKGPSVRAYLWPEAAECRLHPTSFVSNISLCAAVHTLLN